MAREFFKRMLGKQEGESAKGLVERERFPSLVTSDMDVFQALRVLYQQAMQAEFPLDIEKKANLEDVAALYEALRLSPGEFIYSAYIGGTGYFSPFASKVEGSRELYSSGEEFRGKLYAQDLEGFAFLLHLHAAYLQGKSEQFDVLGRGDDPIQTWQMQPHILKQTAGEIEGFMDNYSGKRRYLFVDEVHSELPSF